MPHFSISGTSGDTGSAAISAARGLKWLDVVVLLPKGRCTKIQELQMTTVLDENIHNFAGMGLISVLLIFHTKTWYVGMITTN